MRKNKDTEMTFSNAAKRESGESLKSAKKTVNPAPGEMEIVQPRQGIWRTYDVTDGLPTGPQRALQDRRGYLWLSAWYEPVVCRYDGAEFTIYTIEDRFTGVMSVLEDSQGQLWFGTQGSGVSCFDGQRFINYTAEDGLADNRVWASCEDSQGRLWFGTLDAGVFRFDGRHLVTCDIEGLTSVDSSTASAVR